MSRFEAITINFKDILSTEFALAKRGDVSIRYIKKRFQLKKQFITANHLRTDALHLYELESIMRELIDLVYDKDIDGMVRSILTIYREEFPEEYNNIMTMFHKYNFKDGAHRAIICGDVQSGKTAIMVLTAILYVVYGRDVVIVCRNKLDDKSQFISRFREIAQVIHSRGYTQPICIVDRKDKLPKHACVMIDIYSKKNVLRLMTNVQKRNRQSVAYVDEADVRDDIKDVEFRRLVDSVTMTLFVSATVQDILTSSWKIQGKHIIPLIRKNEYRGIDHVEFIPVDQDEHTIDVKYAFKRVMDEEWKHEYHPKIVLYSCDRTISGINKTFNEMKHNRLFIDDSHSVEFDFQNACIISYAESRIRLFHPHISLDILRQTFPKCKETQPSTFELKTEIKKVLLWLAENGGHHVFETIVIIAGDMANRGINFASFSPNPNYRWHVTHQIGIKSSNASCATINQFMRIFGNHGDDIPLKFYSIPAMWDRIRKSYILSKTIVNAIRGNEDGEDGTTFHTPIFNNMFTDDVCKQLPMNIRRVPQKFIVKKSIENSFLHTERDDLTSAVFSDDEVVEVDHIQDEDIQLTCERFESWKQQDGATKISTFIRLVDPYKVYTKSELIGLLESCGFEHGNADVHLLTYFRHATNSNQNGYGKLFRRLSPDTYQMYPELVESYMNIFRL